MTPFIRRVVTVAAAVSGVVLAIVWWRYVFPPAPPYTLHSRVGVSKGERILVFAPHSDDETLGAGGLIRRAVQVGAVVRVVLVTNGDGFTLAAEDQFHSVHLTPEKYVQLAYIRQKETLTALKLFGVPATAVTFLGFPDRGTPAEWEDNWSLTSPYTSRYTRLSHSPYRNSYVPNAPYSGAQLSAEIERIIREFKPDTVILPHPNDVHPDHWATHNFVLYALATLDELGPKASGGDRHTPRLLNYLVHRGNWPRPKGYVPRVELVPPPRLMSVGTRWSAFTLSRGETAQKYQAILEYRSQVAVMRRYLVSFARANDLFGTLPPTSEVDPQMKTVLVDPVEDTLGREAEGGADLRGIELRAD
ncbi:MAG: PIG-L deacetylase family protein, partial [Methanocella sp.]